MYHLWCHKGVHRQPSFDSDSVEIHVDNCALRCITNNARDFVKPPQLAVGRVKGLCGQKVAVHAIGTIRWTFEDDEGTLHAFLVPGTLYVSDSLAKRLSRNTGQQG